MSTNPTRRCDNCGRNVAHYEINCVAYYPFVGVAVGGREERSLRGGKIGPEDRSYRGTPTPLGGRGAGDRLLLPERKAESTERGVEAGTESNRSRGGDRPG